MKKRMKRRTAMERRAGKRKTTGGKTTAGVTGGTWAGPRARVTGRALLVAAAVWMTVPQLAVAQPDSAEREARLSALFGQMSADTGVRVTTSMLFIEHGSFRGVGEEDVRIEQGGEVVPVPLSDIRSVEVERHHPIQGMLWGLGTGILVGSVSGLLVGSFYCDAPRDCSDEERRGALIGGSALGLAGGVTGFVIGKYRVSWQPVFP